MQICGQRFWPVSLMVLVWQADLSGTNAANFLVSNSLPMFNPNGLQQSVSLSNMQLQENQYGL